VHSAYRADDGEQSSPRHTGRRLFLTRDRGISSARDAASVRSRGLTSAANNPGLLLLDPVRLGLPRPLTAAPENRIVERASHLDCRSAIGREHERHL